MRLLALAVIAVGIGLLPAVAAGNSPPPGATARCVDGTYSFSQHHSGTCSHHGGVAVWLDGSPTTSTTSTSPATGGPKIPVGTTITLAQRTKTSGCTLGPNPDRACSPGAYYSKLTKSVICSVTFRTDDVRYVPQAEKIEVEKEYGLKPKLYGQSLEIDHIVSLELGGSNDIANLYPEKLFGHPGYRIKDKLENKLHDLVCDGKMTLSAVRKGIASDWQALYKKVYGVPPTS